jgi:GNAT superfamily N-acetyltransferase
MTNLTFVAPAATVAAATTELPSTAYTIRPSTTADLEQLGALYFRSYAPGEACETEADAVADVAASFDGDYGEFLHAASPVIVHRDELVAAVMTVRRAPWDDSPDCPFVIELFTAPEHRRAGLGTVLLATAAAAISTHDDTIALRVEATNSAAVQLYGKLGFRPSS